MSEYRCQCGYVTSYDLPDTLNGAGACKACGMPLKVIDGVAYSGDISGTIDTENMRMRWLVAKQNMADMLDYVPPEDPRGYGVWPEGK